MTHFENSAYSSVAGNRRYLNILNFLMIATIVHIIQLIVHCYFMKQNFVSSTFEEFWN